MKYLLILVTALALSACGGSYPPISIDTLSSADVGTYPEKHEELVKEFYSARLKDPFSAKYQISKPVKGYLRKAPINGGEVSQYGYIVYVSMNAKNSYGAYVGWKQEALFIKNGIVSGPIFKNPWFNEPWYK